MGRVTQNGAACTPATALFEHVYGDLRGKLCIATLDPDTSRMEHKYFDYPAQTEAAAVRALQESERGKDAYFCAHLLSAPRRRKESAAAMRALYVDGDGAIVPADLPQPTATVESSPGKHHLYFRLNSETPPEIAEGINQRITHAIGGDPSGYDLTQLLRVPGTKNYKYPDAPEVRLVFVSGDSYSPAELDAVYPHLESRTGHHTAPDPHEPPVRLDAGALRVWRGEKPKPKTDGSGEVERSGTLVKIGRVLFDAGANRPVIVEALRERDRNLPGFQKYTGREDADAQYHKIVDLLEQEGRNGRIKVGLGPGDPNAGGETSKGSTPTRTGGKPNQMDLVRRYQEREPDIAYGIGSWRRYKRGVWGEIDTVEVEKGVLKIIKEAIPEGITPSSNLLASVVNLLRVEVQVPPHEWADPERGIIVCQNGTLELEGRKFREHRREDYALFAVAFDYDPDARAETWERAFTDRLGGSWAFLQEYAGYSLTTRTDLEAATFLVGPPGCGKSTFIEGMEMVAGDQAGTLSLSDMERSLYALSNIGGKTLLTATEAPHLYLKSTATLDALISGEKLQIERKYQQPERVRPVAKILWAMNELPQVRNPSAGLFRRAHIVPLPAVQGKREPLIKELIKTEGSGILNWALEGLDRLNAQRCFSISPEMREAMDNFKAGNDVPAAFVEECCKVDPERREESNLLYAKYKEWCLDNSHKPLASNRIRGEWERLGFERKMIRGKPYYQGVELEEAPRFVP